MEGGHAHSYALSIEKKVKRKLGVIEDKHGTPETLGGLCQASFIRSNPFIAMAAIIGKCYSNEKKPIVEEFFDKYYSSMNTRIDDFKEKDFKKAIEMLKEIMK